MTTNGENRLRARARTRDAKKHENSRFAEPGLDSDRAELDESDSAINARNRPGFVSRRAPYRADVPGFARRDAFGPLFWEPKPDLSSSHFQLIPTIPKTRQNR